MTRQILAPTTAGIHPAQFAGDDFLSRHQIIVLLAVFVLLGAGLRLWNLGAESLSEDELNKLQTVAEYRMNGLSGRNGEHPFLMKGLQTASLTVAEKFNDFLSGGAVSEEFALRFPTALIGTLTILLLFLVFRELFGGTIGLMTGALWAVNPAAVSFDRIAKEDAFLLFFFLLANFFWLRGQTVAESRSGNPARYYRAAAVAFGAMLASKYLPHLIAVSAAYYNIFQSIPVARWRLGKFRWLAFFGTMGAAFIIFNPTILLPETWHEMLIFSGEKRIGHDAYEFMGELYPNRMTLWLAGVPWTFYYVFIAVKTPLLTLLAMVAGLCAMWRKRMGDGRYFVFFWMFMWFMPFSVLGGKFTRYFALAAPLVLLLAAVGIRYGAERLSAMFSKLIGNINWRPGFQLLLFLVVACSSLSAAVAVAPHYRLYTNGLSGGRYYFPHDEFYDLSVRETVAEISARAPRNIIVACETPSLMEYYAARAGRFDLRFVALSDREKIKELAADDFIVDAEGRHYFSNAAYLSFLRDSVRPAAEIKVNGVTAVRLYRLDNDSLLQIHARFAF